MKRKIKGITKTGIVLEGLDMTTYRGEEHPYHVVGKTYRSTSEAFKDATYACAVEKHKSDIRHALEFFTEFFAVLFWAGCAISLPIALVIWLTK